MKTRGVWPAFSVATITFSMTVAGEPDAFEAQVPAFKTKMAGVLGLRTEQLLVTYSAGSVNVQTKAITDSPQQAAAASTSWSVTATDAACKPTGL